MTKAEYEHFAKEIFLAALEVHKELGPGLLESIYQFSLMKELTLRGIDAEAQVKVPVFYKGYETSKEFFIDILVERELVIELKCVDQVHPVHEAQLISYLKLADKQLGFLINFHVALLKDGFKRKVNRYY